MASLQEDICQYLISKGLVIEFGVDCYEDFIPDSPDDVVSIYEYEGDPYNPYTDVVHRSLQVIVRNVVQENAKALANSIHKALQSENLMIRFTDTRIGQVHLRQSPFKLKVDENNRIYYCFNIGITTTMD